VDDSIHNKGGHVKTWIQSNVRRLQDGMIGLFAGFLITSQDVSIAVSMLFAAAFLSVVAYIIGIK